MNVGAVAVREGGHMAVMSTGLVFGGMATAQTSSSLTSGLIPVPSDAAQLVFDWSFASSELDEYVGQTFDDYLSVTVAGPTGATSITLASVNGVGTAGSTAVTIPGLSGVEHTGWQVATIDVAELGSPLTVSFSISDVGDSAFESAAFLDAVRFTGD